MPQAPGITPTQGSSVTPTSELNVNAPLDAFGGAMAHAVSGLGNALERAGDQVWNRAVDIQNRINSTEANNSAATYMEQANKLRVDFESLQGTNASPQALEKYTEGLRTARENIRKGLSNPAVQELYDSHTLSSMGSAIFSGGNHAAKQVLASQIDSLNNRQKVTASQAVTADDPNESKVLHDQSKNLIKERASIQGRDAEPELFEADAAYLAARIQHVTKSDPAAGQKMLAESKEKLGPYFSQTEDIVLATRRGQGSQNIATEVWGANSDVNGPKVSQGEMEAAAERKARELFPNDETAVTAAKNAVSARWNMYQHAKTTDQSEATNDAYNLVLTGKVSNMQEFMASPEGQDIWKRLDPVKQKALETGINNYVKNKGKIVEDSNYARLWGMAKSNDPRAVSEFLNKDLLNENVSQAQLEKLVNVRKQLTKDPKGDPRVTHAMSTLRGALGTQMRELGIDKRSGNEENYDKFTGQLHDAIEDWSEINKKPPSDKDLTDTIGPLLMQKHATPRWFDRIIGPGREPNFIIPESYATAIRSKLAEQGKTADDREVRRAYVQGLMFEYRKQKAKTDGSGR